MPVTSRKITPSRGGAGRRFPSYLVLLLGVAAVAAPTERALAQAGQARVRALTHEATEAYTNLDFERAESLLVRAMGEARRRRVRGRVLAELHIVRGVIAVAARSDIEGGAAAFEAALAADETVEVDRMLSNPQIDSVFREVQRRAGITPRGGHRIPHTPPVEQLDGTPIPVFVQMPDDIDADHLVIRYWPEHQVEIFDEAALEPVAGGFGVELPCAASTGVAVEYYVVAFGEDGEIIAQVGSEEEPYSVPIVFSRTVDAPALPSRRAPGACTGECPPGASCDEGDVAAGGACETDSDCADDLACEDDVCVASDSRHGAGEQRRFFVRGGYAVGSGYARQGSRADSTIPFHPSTEPPGFVGEYAPAGFTETEWLAEIQTLYAGYTENAGNVYTNGPINPDPTCDAPQGEYCVRVQTEGLVVVHGGALELGYLVVPRFAVVAGARIAASAGDGTLSRVLLTVGAELRIVEADPTGFYFDAAAGVGLGQIQLRVPQGGGGVYEPFIRTGLGNLNLALIAGYRFLAQLGVFLKPTLHGFFPDRTFVAEGTLGFEVLF